MQLPLLFLNMDGIISVCQTCPQCGCRYKPRGRRDTCGQCGFSGHQDGVGSKRKHNVSFPVSTGKALHSRHEAWSLCVSLLMVSAARVARFLKKLTMFFEQCQIEKTILPRRRNWSTVRYTYLRTIHTPSGTPTDIT
jgi:hypothetical protein